LDGRRVAQIRVVIADDHADLRKIERIVRGLLPIRLTDAREMLAVSS